MLLKLHIQGILAHDASVSRQNYTCEFENCQCKMFVAMNLVSCKPLQVSNEQDEMRIAELFAVAILICSL